MLSKQQSSVSSNNNNNYNNSSGASKAKIAKEQNPFGSRKSSLKDEPQKALAVQGSIDSVKQTNALSNEQLSKWRVVENASSQLQKSGMGSLPHNGTRQQVLSNQATSQIKVPKSQIRDSDLNGAGRLAKVLSSKDNLKGMIERTSSVGVGMPGLEITSLKKDPEVTSDDQITLNESHNQTNRLEGHSVLTTHLMKGKEDEIQVNQRAANDNMKVAVFKVPVARNERNLSNNNNRVSPSLMEIDKQQSASVNASQLRKSGNFARVNQPPNPSVLYLHLPPGNAGLDNKNTNTGKHVKHYPMGAGGFKSYSPQKYSPEFASFARGSPQQQSQLSDRTDLLNPTLHQMFNSSNNVKKALHQVKLELPQMRDDSPHISNGFKKNFLNSKLAVTTLSLADAKRQSAAQFGSNLSRDNIDAIIKLQHAAQEQEEEGAIETLQDDSKADNMVAAKSSRRPRQHNKRRMSSIMKDGQTGVNQGVRRSLNAKDKIERVATKVIDYTGLINEQENNSYRGNQGGQFSFRASARSPYQIGEVPMTAEAKSKSGGTSAVSQGRMGMTTNSWIKMRNTHFGFNINGQNQKSSLHLDSVDDNVAKEHSLNRSVDGKEVQKCLGVKGAPKKMPFYHFNMGAQQKLKAKQSPQASNSKKQQILVKPPQAQIIRGNGKMELFRTDDSKQGVDRSMQMSVSFRAMQLVRGSNLPSQVTVGEIPPPTPTPMRQKGIYDSKPHTRSTQRAGSKLSRSGANDPSVQLRKRGNEASSLQNGQSKNRIEYSQVADGPDNVTNQQEPNHLGESNFQMPNSEGQAGQNNIFSFTNLSQAISHKIPQPETVLSKHQVQTPQNVKPESADINILDQSDGGIKSSVTSISKQSPPFPLPPTHISQRNISADERSPTNNLNSAQAFQENIRVIQNIYKNFEKHNLPARMPKDVRQDLRKITIQQDDIGSLDVVNRAKETLLYDKYKRFEGQGFCFKEEFYLKSNPETGIESGELKKRDDQDQYYRLRALCNTQKYIDMLNQKIMSDQECTPKGTQLKARLLEGSKLPERAIFSGNSTQRMHHSVKESQVKQKLCKLQEDSLNQAHKLMSTDRKGELMSLNLEDEVRRLEYQRNVQEDEENKIQDYNRFAHLLQFSTGSITAPIKRTDILNQNRNEALLRIREKIRSKVHHTEREALSLALVDNIPQLAFPGTTKANQTQQSFNPQHNRVWSQVSPRQSPQNGAAVSHFMGHTIGNDPYIDYLANKTFLLPALSDQKQSIMHSKILKSRGNTSVFSAGILSPQGNNQSPRQPKKASHNRTQINTLLHMKLQPKLRMTSQDWDFTKDKLDLTLLLDQKKRNKKEESDRLMSSINESGNVEKPKLMLLSNRSNLRDSQNSDVINPQLQSKSVQPAINIQINGEQQFSLQNTSINMALQQQSSQQKQRGSIKRSNLEQEPAVVQGGSPIRRKVLDNKSNSMAFAIEGVIESFNFA